MDPLITEIISSFPIIRVLDTEQDQCRIRISHEVKGDDGECVYYKSMIVRYVPENLYSITPRSMPPDTYIDPRRTT